MSSYQQQQDQYAQYQQQNQQQQQHNHNQQQYSSPSPPPLPSSASPSPPPAVHVNVHHVPPQPRESFGVRVMRLPSPAFQPKTMDVQWQLDTHQPTIRSVQSSPIASSPSSSASCPSSYPPFVLSPLLLLPTNIGTVYLGESFRACISVCQQMALGSGPLLRVGVRIELQTSSRRWTLHDSTSLAHARNMSPGDSEDMIVEHTLSELGVNCLVCYVSYVDSASSNNAQQVTTSAGQVVPERRSFQKFFKFQVYDPFTLHTTLHQRDIQFGSSSGSSSGFGSADRSTSLLAEVQLTSRLERAVFLDEVTVISASSMQVKDWNGSVDDSDSEQGTIIKPEPSDGSTSSGARGVLLPGQSSRSFLFRLVLPPASASASSSSNADPLTATASSASAAAAASAASAAADGTIGRLQIRWRSLLGENGRIASGPLTRTIKSLSSSSSSSSSSQSTSSAPSVLSSRDVDFSLVSAPARVLLESPFTLRGCLRNLSGFRVLAVLQLLPARMGTLLPLGATTRQLGVMEPGESKELGWSMLGVGLGVQRVAGVKVTFTQIMTVAINGESNNMPDNTKMISVEFDTLHQLEVTQDEVEDDEEEGQAEQ